MCSAVSEFISKGLSSWSEEVPALVKSIEASVSSTHATSSSFCEQLSHSWEILLEKLSSSDSMGPIRLVEGEPSALAVSGGAGNGDSLEYSAPKDSGEGTNDSVERIFCSQCSNGLWRSS